MASDNGEEIFENEIFESFSTNFEVSKSSFLITDLPDEIFEYEYLLKLDALESPEFFLEFTLLNTGDLSLENDDGL